jgi:hypothetical protein
MHSTLHLHKYVLSLVGIFLLFAVTFPIALLRVSQSEKFSGAYLKSLAPEYQPESKLNQ